mmetsp:Transcript_10689/g.25354  ORF Transcript_10689/g.25354 Transcript_10689/m.25354 type:complete len:255 (-) Transcript_10689:1300-2064(-)
MTRCAAVNVSPCPAARMLRTAALQLSFSWKEVTSPCRSCDAVDPSMRMNLTRFFRRHCSIPSRRHWWWAKMRNFSSFSRRSLTYSWTAAILECAEVKYSLFKRRFSSSFTPLTSPPSCCPCFSACFTFSSSHSTSFTGPMSFSVSCRKICWRIFAGSWSRTSFFRRRFMNVDVQRLCSSSRLLAPASLLHLEPWQYRSENLSRVTFALGRSASICWRISIGRLRAGVPLQRMQRRACFSSGTVCFVRTALWFFM